MNKQTKSGRSRFVHLSVPCSSVPECLSGLSSFYLMSRKNGPKWQATRVEERTTDFIRAEYTPPRLLFIQRTTQCNAIGYSLYRLFTCLLISISIFFLHISCGEEHTGESACMLFRRAKNNTFQSPHPAPCQTNNNTPPTFRFKDPPALSTYLSILTCI